MNDALGRELKIGQQVAYASCLCNSIYITNNYVVAFTPKRVRLSSNPQGKGSTCVPHNCVILEGTE